MSISNFFKRNWIHFAAIGIFLIVCMTYFSLQLKGYGLKQHDIEQYIGSSHEIADFREQTNGEEPLWTNSMFGGMPATQISVIHSGNIFSNTIIFLSRTIPSPMGIVLLYMVGFYIMLSLMRVNKWVAIGGALVYAFLSYQIIILQAGHNSKAVAVAFMAPVVGAFIMAYRRNWLWGSLLSGLFMSFEIASNHLQVTYYLVILIFGLGVAELFRVFKTKAWGTFFKATGGIIAMYLLAFVINYGNVGMTNAYAKNSTRGSNDLTITAEGEAQPAQEGLDVDYVTQYSYGIDESFTFLSPYVKGGGSMAIGDSPFREQIEASTNLTQQEIQDALNSNAYWGNQLSTSGPVYLGVILVFLALLGMIYLKDPSKWALLGVSILVLMLSWGKNYMGLTEWFLENVPAYNKFRAVTIILVIVELTVPLLAVLFLDRLIKEKDKIVENIKPFYIASAAFVVFLIGLKGAGLGDNYVSAQETDTTMVEKQIEGQKEDIRKQIMAMTPEQAAQYGIDVSSPAGIEAAVDAQAKGMMDGFLSRLESAKKARVEIFNSSMNRSIMFSILAIACLFLFLKTSVPVAVSMGALGLFTFLDVVLVAHNYLNNKEDQSGNYKYWTPKLAASYPMTPELGDLQIRDREVAANPALQKEIAKAKSAGEAKAMELDAVGGEKTRIVDAYIFRALNRMTNYRVFDVSGGFNSARASFFHKSLGGYHGAKLRTIQNMIEFHISKSNNKVLDMFNVKYILQPTDSGLVANPNPTACGNGWFVKRAQVVNDANEAILSLGSKFSMKNIGTGKFIVNGVVKPVVDAFGSERLQYLPEGSRDTIAVPLSNGIPLGVTVVFVQDQKGKTDLIMKEGFERDTTKSFTGLVEFTVTDDFNPRDEAVVIAADASKLNKRNYSGEGKIQLTKYAPNKLNYTSDSKTGGLAVFSEVYYPENWSATIDGKPADIIKVNYMLRGLDIPAGKHKIEFQYVDQAYDKYNFYSLIGTIILLLIAIGVFLFDRKRKQVVE
jgi:hypothetical protein